MQRGFDPLSDIFGFYDVSIVSPLYKKKEHKQSNLSKEERAKVNDVIFRKEHYTPVSYTHLDVYKRQV